MKRKFLFLPCMSLALLAGCEDLGEPLGDCKDPNVQGRRPVVVGGQVMYAGQAIMVRSCASGVCHNGSVTGELRYGVPAGLDFDVPPVATAGPVRSDGKVEPDPQELARLRAHQRKIFDNRTSIWDQVTKGLMPPGGVGEPWRQAKPGTLVSVTGANCTLGQELGPITDATTREELREWLACGAPVVEVNAADLPMPTGGIVGDQFPSCGGSEPVDATFENVFEQVFVDNGCVLGCHEPGGARSSFDLSTPAIAYETLMGMDGAGAPSNCASSDTLMVTPRNPETSYLFAIVGGGEEAGTLCNPLMPFGSQGLPAEPLELLERWISAGAPGPGEGAGDSDAGAGDAGL